MIIGFIGEKPKVLAWILQISSQRGGDLKV